MSPIIPNVYQNWKFFKFKVREDAIKTYNSSQLNESSVASTYNLTEDASKRFEELDRMYMSLARGALIRSGDEKLIILQIIAPPSIVI